MSCFNSTSRHLLSSSFLLGTITVADKTEYLDSGAENKFSWARNSWAILIGTIHDLQHMNNRLQKDECLILLVFSFDTIGLELELLKAS